MENNSNENDVFFQDQINIPKTHSENGASKKIKKNNTKELSDRYVCKYCNWTFKTRGNLDDHIRRHLKLR